MLNQSVVKSVAKFMQNEVNFEHIANKFMESNLKIGNIRVILATENLFQNQDSADIRTYGIKISILKMEMARLVGTVLKNFSCHNTGGDIC